MVNSMVNIEEKFKLANRFFRLAALLADTYHSIERRYDKQWLKVANYFISTLSEMLFLY